MKTTIRESNIFPKFEFSQLKIGKEHAMLIYIMSQEYINAVELIEKQGNFF